MTPTHKRVLVLTVGLLCAAGLWWPLSPADGPKEGDFTAGEPVESIELKLDLAAEGDDLEEPVALDLGLGFPLWLHPVGRAAEEPAPFGAVAQATSAKGKVKAGDSATFSFTLKGDPGQDLFLTTPQLLAGLRVGDIARVGFASTGSSNWAIAGYDIKINGKAFASAKPGAKAKSAQEEAQKKLVELIPKYAKLEGEAAELNILVKS
jgi:hypothetical protein